MLYPPLIQYQKFLDQTETDQQKQKQVHPSHIFLHLSADFWLKIQNTHHYRHRLTFLTSEQSALSSPVNGPAMTYLKIQNRLSRAL